MTAPVEMGVRGYIYRSPLGDFSNGGISSHAIKVTIVGEGVPRVALVTEDAPAVTVDVRGGAVHLRPLEDPPAGSVGWMMGGCYVAATDGRFQEAVGRRYVAIPLHDRCETNEQYATLTAGD